MAAELICFNPECRKRFAIDEVIYQCSACGGLIEASNDLGGLDAGKLRAVWDQRRLSRLALDVSGVWRYREMLPFLDDPRHVVTLGEGNTHLFDGALASFRPLYHLQTKRAPASPA